jgi:putative transposase
MPIADEQSDAECRGTRFGGIGDGVVSFADGQVTFLWRDSAHNNEQKPMTLPLDKFLRRFLLHILPQGFVRIRHFGFLANRRRATLLRLLH